MEETIKQLSLELSPKEKEHLKWFHDAQENLRKAILAMMIPKEYFNDGRLTK